MTTEEIAALQKQLDALAVRLAAVEKRIAAVEKSTPRHMARVEKR